MDSEGTYRSLHNDEDYVINSSTRYLNPSGPQLEITIGKGL